MANFYTAVPHSITFGDIRGFVSRIDCVSICSLETGGYENFHRITEVPHAYDSKYLHGFGMIESDFTVDGATALLPCIEIMLSEKPRREREEE